MDDATDRLLEATSAFLRDALEQIARAAKVPIDAEYGPKPNGVLLDDILSTLNERAE